MANALTTVQPKQMSDLPQWLRSSVQAMTPDYPPRIPADRSLTPSQRAEVERLTEACDRSMDGATTREIGAIVTRLLADYPADGVNPVIEKARAQNWIDALDGMPAWALEAARLKWVRGEVEGANPDFPPKPARFRDIAVECMGPVFQRKSQLHRLLIAVPIEEGNLDDEKRERVVAMLEKLSSDMKAASDPRFPRAEPEGFISPKDREQAHFDHAKDLGEQFRADPVAMSHALRAKLGLDKDQAA